MTEYIETYRPITEATYYRMTRSLIENEIRDWEQMLEGQWNGEINRSQLTIGTAELQIVSVTCPSCRRQFAEITYLDNPESLTGCPNCHANLQY